jgi:hypothetical protein
MATLVFLALLFGLAALIISLLNLAEIEKHDGAINALREIQGVPGPRGMQGEPGHTGMPGPQGKTGIPGCNGATGRDWPNWDARS